MIDQATALRKLAAENNRSSLPKSMRIIAVTSGKGGVGKTNFTLNLAIALRAYQYRVLILDGDLGMANIDVICGLTPKYTLQHLLLGERKIEDIIAWGPLGIGILPGGSGVQELANLEKPALKNVVENLGRLESLTDILIIDTGAGLNHTVMNFLRAADDIILVATPEPTALTDAYGLLKALRSEGGEAIANVVINRVRSERAAQTAFNRLEVTAHKFLQGSLNLLGWVYDDPEVGEAVMKQEPLAVAYPSSMAYRCIQWIAGNVAGIYQSPPRHAKGIRGFLGSLWR